MDTVAVQRRTITSRNIVEIDETIRRTFANHRPTLLGPVVGCRLSLDAATVGDLAMDHLQLSLTTRYLINSEDHVVIDQLATGRVGMALDGRDEHRFGPGDTFLIPPAVPTVVTLDDIDVRDLHLPLAAVVEAATREFGVRAANFRFTATTTIPGTEEPWRRTMAYLQHLASGPDGMFSHRLLYAAAVDLAATAVLQTFPNTAITAGYCAEPGWTAPATVRRAVAYLDEHAHEAITISSVAAAVGTDARALRAAFRRHLGSTPSAYLRRVRLANVHRDLQAAQPGDATTVSAIARHWGFIDLDRFATDYRNAYGQPPDRTLNS